MNSTVKELQKKIIQYEKWNNNLNCFLKENGFENENDLKLFIKKYKNHNYNNINIFDTKDSDYIKELNNINHNIHIHKYDLLFIKISIYKYKTIKNKSSNTLKEIKDNKSSSIFKNISKELSILEKEYDDLCKIPRCIYCECIFDNININYSIKKYDLIDICKDCANKELKKIIREQKFIKQIDEKYKNNKIVNKLLTKNYYNLAFYNEIYIENQNEKINLYDDDIVKYAGFKLENEWDKYKLSNLCYRANKLIELFEDKIKFINISEWKLARMGKLEFEVLCSVLYDSLGGYESYESIIKALNMNNIEEPNSDFESDNENDYIPFSPDEEYISDDEMSTSNPKKTYVLRFS
jgi:hypothetical protein